MSFGLPIISVVLPVYNGAEFISEAVDSILAQTFRNFELIIIDDGSKDTTLEILKRYESYDNRIRLISRKNKGLVISLNEGIELARGDWIARMDADDISLPHRFERQLEFLKETKADICGSWIKYFGVGDRRVWKTYQSDMAIKMDMLFKCPLAHPTVIFRAHALKKLRYGIAWDFAEDYDLWTRSAIAGLTMTNVPEVLLHYRRHSKQISTLTYSKQQFFTKKVIKNYSEFMSQELGLNPDLLKNLLLLESSNCDFASLKLELALEKLINGATNEVRSAASQGISRICYTLAADHWDIVIRLSKSIKKLGVELSITTWLQLAIIHFFRLRVGGRMFIVVMKLHSFFFSGSRA
jgi:glycosyltransferase involved in cell wall biosynthesis